MSLFNAPVTNIFWDGEVGGYNPDCVADYYYASDALADHNYWQTKIAEALLSLAGDTTKEYTILYGGVVSDGGSGTINISEGAWIGKDTAGNRRIGHIPALTGIALPSGWNNNRQIWVIGKYDFKLGTATRNHWIGTSYHYQVMDTYIGDSGGYVSTSTDDLFLDADPGETVVCLGSFKMNSTTFADYNSAERTETFGLKARWVSTQLLGSGLTISGATYPALAALNGADVAFIDSINHSLRCYRFNELTWSLVGSGLTISGVDMSALAALNGTDVAFIDTGNQQLRCYRFNGSTWSLVGSGLDISSVGLPALAALNGTDVAFIDGSNDSLRCYRFNGSTWSLVGSGLTISGAGNPALTALNGTDVAFIDSSSFQLRCYRFNGSTWSLVGSGLNISGAIYLALAALNGTDVAFIHTTDNSLRWYRFNGSTWLLVGSGLTISGATYSALAALNGTDVAFIDSINHSLRCYRCGFSMSGSPHHP